MLFETAFSKKNRFKKVLGTTFALTFSHFLFLNTAHATWYRYYDNRGIANISTTVSPEHIRRGYETLDSRMQVIRKAQPFESEQFAKLEAQREQAYKQRNNDIRLKSAYSNSHLAEIKKREMLTAIQQQINFQKKQLNLIYKDQLILKQQEQAATLSGKAIPSTLKNALQTNANQIERTQNSILISQTSYQRTEQQYDAIIARLKVLETQN
ncbi:hypothetical protein [Acinetobacter sp. HY1485]|uniref:hypothetical protein n=1 Tax=Acinetobacter sp. HY1485 TaxID=2970918 RepID=UPI0022B94B49|nr:hypothetical protein [Acinetobacter sp. HY1485]